MTVLVTAWALWSHVALALDPGRTMDQYIRDRWQAENGFPGGHVHAIAQSADGYLWIAADNGLVRFDGLTFRLFVPPGTISRPAPPVVSVVADAAGGLWVELRNAALGRVRRNGFEDLPPDVAASSRLVSAMASRNDGMTIFAWLAQGVIGYRAGRVETVVPRSAMPSSYVIAIATAPDGDLWLGTRDSGLLRLHGGHLTTIVSGLPDQKINSLLTGDHDLWIGTDHGIARWNGTEVTWAGVPDALRHVAAQTMIRDRHANVWVVTASGQLLRVSRQGIATLDAADHAAIATAVFEDREGNIWVGTSRGLERLRAGAFVSYSTPQGLPARGLGPVYATADRVWVAPTDGGLYSVQDNRATAVTVPGLLSGEVYSIAGAGGDVWLGRRRGGLTRLRVEGDRWSARTFTQADGLAQDNVYAVHVTHDGAVWAGTLSGGVSRLKDGRITTFTSRDGLASNTVTAIVEGADGTVWLATPSGVSAWAHGSWRRYTTDDGLPSNDIKTVFEDSRRVVWVGTAAGLAVIAGGRVQGDFRPPPLLRSPIFGIAEDRVGSLWIATADHVLSVQRQDLQEQAVDLTLRNYGVGDGLLGVESVSRHRSIVADPRGRIWISTSRGLSMVDPNSAIDRARPALVQLEQLSADGTSIPLDGSGTIPPRRQRVTVTFTALTLATPERTRFRYRLDGFDRGWSEPSTDRQAVYTNLGPGSYRFHLSASNANGEWDLSEASVAFSIAPALWQTAWFRFVLVLLVATLGFGAHRLRVLQMTRRLKVRFDDRLQERTRIAQELHDTLLQGLLSASMQLHVVVKRLPADSAVRSSLSGVLDIMRTVLDEGRDAVSGLRSSSAETTDLEQALSGILTELGMDDAVEYRVIVEGDSRPLQPIIRDDIYRIGREAVVNACRHAEAKRIELALEYTAAGLRLVVRDDGRGIDAAVLRAGSEGHWGLPGMRERAQRIGARFTVSSRAGAGTEVELMIPGRVVFARGKKS
jgi:signal transduction histidine kinase